MGDNIEESNKKEKLSSYTEVFEKQCPFFMSIGMSYQEFWYEDCWIANYYLKAYTIKKDQINEQLWLQGMYVFEAILCASPVLHAFSKKGTKPLKYPKEPYPLHKKTKEEEEEENRREVEKVRLYFENWSKRVSKDIKSKQKKDKEA